MTDKFVVIREDYGEIVSWHRTKEHAIAAADSLLREGPAICFIAQIISEVELDLTQQLLVKEIE